MVNVNELTEDETLPNLPNEITGEQLVLQQKVFRYNEEFVKNHKAIIKWLQSPEDSREYPKHALKHKYAY